MKKNTPNYSIELSENPHDEQRLLGDQAQIELPDLEDIPGQKKNHPDSIRTIIPDTTVSSADEEADRRSLHPDDGARAGPSPGEFTLDSETHIDDDDKALYEKLSLEKEDNDGDALNEKSLKQDLFGEDLDCDLVWEEEAEDE